MEEVHVTRVAKHANMHTLHINGERNTSGKQTDLQGL